VPATPRKSDSQRQKPSRPSRAKLPLEDELAALAPEVPSRLLHDAVDEDLETLADSRREFYARRFSHAS
jgi:hypothetical protein